MATITALDGTIIDIVPANIVRVAGPLPKDTDNRTYIYGATPAALNTAEAPAALLARLGITDDFASLTRPNGTPVWVKGVAVSSVRAPLPSELGDPGAVNATVIVGGARQMVHETPPQATAAINSHGGHL